MLICHCHSISDRRIREEAREGARTVGQIGRATKAGTCCGGCVPAIREVLDSTRRLPVFASSPTLGADWVLAAE